MVIFVYFCSRMGANKDKLNKEVYNELIKAVQFQQWNRAVLLIGKERI